MDGLIQQNSLLISLLAGNLVQRPVRNGLHRQGGRIRTSECCRGISLRPLRNLQKRRRTSAIGDAGAGVAETEKPPARASTDEGLDIDWLCGPEKRQR